MSLVDLILSDPNLNPDLDPGLKKVLDPKVNIAEKLQFSIVPVNMNFDD